MPGLFQSAPGSYNLGPGEVHIWKAPLASTNQAIASLRPILSSAERERAARFQFEKDQARFTSCRARLRLLLSRYIAVPPDKIVFRYDPGGKPALSGPVGWQFNVSHSRDLAAIAISRFDPLGIDIELIDPLFPRDEVAPDILAPDELSDLAALPPSDQPPYFFHLWTLKESLLKAAGGGLSIDPRTICIRLDHTLSPTIISSPPDFRHATLHHFPFHDHFAAALAILAPVKTLTFFTTSG